MMETPTLTQNARDMARMALIEAFMATGSVPSANDLDAVLAYIAANERPRIHLTDFLWRAQVDHDLGLKGDPTDDRR